MAQADLDTLPGQTGDGSVVPRGVRVYDATAAPSAEFGIDEIVLSPNAQFVWLSFMADQPWFIIWGQVGAVPDPDPTARTTSAPGVQNQQCIRIPADYEYMRKVTKKTAPAFKILRAGDTDAIVRLERVSILSGRTNVGA